MLMKMPAVSEMKIKMKLLLLVLFPLFAVSVIIGVCSGIMSAANLEKENSDRLQVALEGFSGDVNAFKEQNIDITVFEGDVRKESSIEGVEGTKAGEAGRMARQISIAAETVGAVAEGATAQATQAVAFSIGKISGVSFEVGFSVSEIARVTKALEQNSRQMQERIKEVQNTSTEMDTAVTEIERKIKKTNETVGKMTNIIASIEGNAFGKARNFQILGRCLFVVYKGYSWVDRDSYQC